MRNCIPYLINEFMVITKHLQSFPVNTCDRYNQSPETISLSLIQLSVILKKKTYLIKNIPQNMTGICYRSSFLIS